MKARAVCVIAIALVVISIVGIPLYSSAQTISTSIGGSPGPSGPSSLNIAGTYPNGVTITQSSPTAGNPRIDVVNDGQQDYLVMRNAKITTPTPVTNYVISFWATLAPLPNVNQPYDTHLIGTFTRSNGITAATGDTVLLRAWFDNAQIGSTQSQTMGAGSSINLTTSSPSLGGSRAPGTLKHQITLTTLQANDRFNGATVVGGRVRNTAATDVCDQQRVDRCEDDMRKASSGRGSIEQQMNPSIEQQMNPSMGTGK